MQTSNAAANLPPSVNQVSTSSQTDRYTIHLPALMPGVRCYADASLLPDQILSPPRTAGLGIFLVNTQVQPAQTIYIKALMTATTSVLMAEAAARALAAIVTDCLGLQQVTFL